LCKTSSEPRDFTRSSSDSTHKNSSDSTIFSKFYDTSDHSSDEDYQKFTNSVNHSDDDNESENDTYSHGCDSDDGSEECLSDLDSDYEEGSVESTNSENDSKETCTTVDNIMSQRDLPFVKKVGGGKDKIFAEPSHHDFDVGLGGWCNQKCLCKVDKRRHARLV